VVTGSQARRRTAGCDSDRIAFERSSVRQSSVARYHRGDMDFAIHLFGAMEKGRKA
jgi:hypothetical protein